MDKKENYLGSGSSSKVFRIIEPLSNISYAVKIADKSRGEDIVNQFLNENNILKRLKHRHIVSYYGFHEDDEKIGIFLELLGNDMLEVLDQYGRLTEDQCRYYFRQMVDAIMYCHQNRVAHRDIKLENFLTTHDRSKIKLIDFGLADVIPISGLMDKYCGSPMYASPEIHLGVPYCGKKTDIWSLGITLFIMATGHFPFRIPEDQNLNYEKVLKKKLKIPDHLSHELKDLLRNMLKKNPKRRISIYDIKYHHWFNNERVHKGSKFIRYFKRFF